MARITSIISEVLELNLCLLMKIKDLDVRDSSRVVSSDKALCTTFSLFIQVYKWVPAAQLAGEGVGGGGRTAYNGLYGEAPPEKGIFFRPQVYTKGLGFYSLKYTKGQWNLSFGSVEGPKRANR